MATFGSETRLGALGGPERVGFPSGGVWSRRARLVRDSRVNVRGCLDVRLTGTIENYNRITTERKCHVMFKPRKSRADSQIQERTYSSNEVAKVARVTLRQLQWWDERKVVSPRHEGHRRVYFPAEVIEITVIAQLRRKGFSLQQIRKVLRFLQREMGRRVAEVLHSSSDLHLVTDGKSIYLEDQHERIIDIFKKPYLPAGLQARTPCARACARPQSVAVPGH